MKIALLGHREIFSNVGLSLVVDGLSGHDLALYLSFDHQTKRVLPLEIEALERFEQRLCDSLQSDTNAIVPGFEALATRIGTPIIELRDPNSDQGLAALERFSPDLIVSIRYRRILRSDAIGMPTHGVLNWHSGLLPEYRGAMATFWSMLNGETKIGSTFHYIADGTIDTGPVVERLERELDITVSYFSNVLALYTSGAAAIVRAIDEIARTGAAKSAPQAGIPRYYSFPDREAVDRFLSQGWRLFDGDELQRFLRTP